MRNITLQALTWGTVATAVASAFWLASMGGGPSPRQPQLSASDKWFKLPTQPTGAGASPAVGAARAPFAQAGASAPRAR